MPNLELHSLSKRFHGPDGRTIPAVEQVTLDVAHGELLAIVGPSAGGKTTLLRLVAGLEVEDEGRIVIGAREVTGRPPGERDAAMVFQTLALYPHMSVAENIGFGLRLRGLPRAEISRRVNAIAERLELRGCLGRNPSELSGGQRQRVALARALIRRPGILLLDEPFSHLDRPLRRQLRSELRALHGEFALTTLMVTHDLADAEILGDRLAVMNAGRIEQHGPLSRLRAEPATGFVRDFLHADPV